MSINIENPFPGLRSFDYNEHHLFFGREQHIQDLINKLNLHHFVAVVGSSGSGKSSLIRAGLLPAINNGALGGQDSKWLIASMKPGNTPLQNLAEALLKQSVFKSGDPVKDKELQDNIYNLINESSLGLIQAVRYLLTNNKRLLILVDQFEELFRFSDETVQKNNKEAQAFANLIIDSVRQKDIPIYVVLTLRSDFLGDCVRFEGLPEAINDGHYLVPRLNKEQNKLAITGPVDYAKGKISPRLVQQVINELGDNPDQLPVLQHALMRTWEKWTEIADPGEPMDVRHYEMIGSMENALSEHADEAYNELKNDTDKKRIELVFKILTVKTGDNRGVRRPTSVDSILKITGITFDELKNILTPFRKSGRTFILPSEENQITTKTILDISHESLMRGWKRLQLWVDEEMESADIYERLCSAALLYREGRSGLWRDPELQLALDWKKRNDPNEAWSLQYNNDFNAAMNFLSESEKERAAEANRKKKRTIMVRSAVVTFMVVVSILTAWALVQTKTATEKSVVAEQKTQEALNQKALAEKAKEMALEASKEAMDAKTYAELQSNIAGEQKKLAESQKSKAEEEALRATAQEQEALRQKQLAEQKRLEALNEKTKADSAQMEATRLRLISLSQNIAFKSSQQKDDAQLGALLAAKAYQLTVENNGNNKDPQLYNALYISAQKTDPEFKQIVIRENDDIETLILNGSQLSVITHSGQLNSYNNSNFSSVSQNKLGGLPAAQNTAYISENGKLLAIGTSDNSVAVYTMPSYSQPQILSGHTGLIRAVAFTNKPTLLATGGRDSTAIIWENYKVSKTIKCSARIKSLKFNNQETKLYIGCEDGVVYEYNMKGGEKSKLTEVSNGRVQEIKVSESGKLIICGFSNGVVQIINSNGKVMRSLNEPGSVEFISISESDGLFATATANKLIHLYQLNDLSLKPIEIKCTSSIVSLELQKDDFVYAACSDRSVKMYPIKTSFLNSIVKQKINRSLTNEEWNTYIGSDLPYSSN